VDESPVHYILRAIGRGFALVAAGYWLVGLTLIIITSGRPHRFGQPTAGQLVVFFTASVVVLFAGVTLQSLLCEGIRRVLEARSADETTAERRQALCIVAIWTLLCCLVGWGGSFAGMMSLFAYTGGPQVTPVQFWCVFLGASLLGLPLTFIQARDWRAATRRFDNWESLDLNELSSG
jgi:hypothetical protein